MNMLARIPQQDGLTTLHDRVSRLFNDVLGDGPAAANGEKTWIPAIDVVDMAEEVLVQVELPGIDPKTVDTTVNGEYLEISGKKPLPEHAADAKWYRFERLSGAFRRRIHMPYKIDTDKIAATASHGLMTIRLPKAPDVLPKKIAVKVKS